MTGARLTQLSVGYSNLNLWLSPPPHFFLSFSFLFCSFLLSSFFSASAWQSPSSSFLRLSSFARVVSVRAAAPGPLLENHSFRMHSRRCVFLVHNVLQKLSKCSRTCWIESILVEKIQVLDCFESLFGSARIELNVFCRIRRRRRS